MRRQSSMGMKTQNLDQAGPFVMENRGAAAVVCVHGFGATPFEVLPVGRALAEAGFHVVGPAVAGHAIVPFEDGFQVFRKTTRFQWLASVRSAVQDLRQRFPRVYIYGQSMGGLIALSLGAEAMADAVAVTGAALVLPRAARWLEPVLKHVDLQVPDLNNRVPGNPRYGIHASGPILQLLELSRETARDLGRIRCPVLACHARKDEAITPRVVKMMEQRIPGPLEVQWFPRSGHTMTMDVEAEAVISSIVRFLTRIEASAGVGTDREAR
jgi:carboxylesterase